MTDFGLLEKFVFMVQKNCLKLSISKVLSQDEREKMQKRKTTKAERTIKRRENRKETS